MVKKYLLFGFVILLAAGIFAQLDNSDYSIEKSYARGENIKGWINIDLEDDPTTSIFSDSVGNSIKLIDLLETNSKHKYDCDPVSCDSFYSASSSEQTKTINLNAEEETLIGFNLKTDIDEIKDFALTISSNAGEMCGNQIKVDLFDDGVNELGNTKVGSQFCTQKNYSCFDSSDPTISEGKMTGTYCQRITLPESPGFKFGAWIKKESGSADLSIELYKDGWLGDQGGECDLPGATSVGSEISCDIDYLVTKEDDYYVCVRYTPASGEEYKIKAHLGECAFKGDPSRGNMEETAAYQIFAQPKSFSAVGNLEITNDLQTGDSVSDLIDDYLHEGYGGLDCSGKDCIVPIKLASGSQQDLTITGEIGFFDILLGLDKPDKLIYDVSEDPALITAETQKIFLDGGDFMVPNEIGTYDFVLSFDGNDLVSEEVEVKKGVSLISINPTKTAAGLPTNFKVNLESEKAIKSYSWDFGDETIEQKTTTNQATHTYDEIGSYSILLSVEDIEGTKSSREFDVEVGSASEILDDLITKKEDDLTNIQTQLTTYDTFTSNAIEGILDLENIDQNLEQINLDYTAFGDTGTEKEYQTLLAELLEIELPRSVTKTLSFSSLPFFPKKENINLNVISSIAGGDYVNQEAYRDAILSWNLDNTQVDITTEEFSANYDSGEGFLVKTFKVDINDLGARETPYVFIEDTGIVVDDPSFTRDSGYYYKVLDGDEIIEFYTTEQIDFKDLPLVVSPSLSSLSVVSDGTTSTPSDKGFNWLLFIIILLGVVVIGIVVYLLLKKWYDEKYENYLFKDKNDLYNMVIYIKNAKEQGVPDKEIIKNLKKSKWSNEQINYVMKKYAGKKTGMPGFSKANKSVPQQGMARAGNYPAKKRF